MPMSTISTRARSIGTSSYLKAAPLCPSDLFPRPLLLKEKGRKTALKPLSFRRGVGVRLRGHRGILSRRVSSHRLPAGLGDLARRLRHPPLVVEAEPGDPRVPGEPLGAGDLVSVE